MVGLQNLKNFIEEFCERRNHCTDATKIQAVLSQKYHYNISKSRVQRLLAADGHRWRKALSIQSYVNRPQNIRLRKDFARKMLQVMEAKYMIVNIDETGFHETSNRGYTWIKKGTEVRNTWRQSFPNITLLAAVTNNADLYYCLIKGSNTQHSYSMFLKMLALQLDVDYPHWRQTAVVLQDNCPLHKT